MAKSVKSHNLRLEFSRILIPGSSTLVNRRATESRITRPPCNARRTMQIVAAEIASCEFNPASNYRCKLQMFPVNSPRPITILSRETSISRKLVPTLFIASREL